MVVHNHRDLIVDVAIDYQLGFFPSVPRPVLSQAKVSLGSAHVIDLAEVRSTRSCPGAMGKRTHASPLQGSVPGSERNRNDGHRHQKQRRREGEATKAGT